MTLINVLPLQGRPQRIAPRTCLSRRATKSFAVFASYTFAHGGFASPVRAGYAVFSLSGTSKVSTYFEVAGDV